MKFVARTVLALALVLSAAARAEHVAIDLSGTSPAGASATAVGATSSTQIGMFATCSFYAAVTGGTGGTLDIYVQSLFKQINTTGVWVDVAHLQQLAAAAPTAAFGFTLTRWGAAAPTFVAVNTASGTPTLAVNTITTGLLGYQLRIVYKTGAGNTVGAAQTILATCSST